MPYVQRDENGNIISVFRWRNEGRAEEFALDTDPEVVSFRDSLVFEDTFKEDIIKFMVDDSASESEKQAAKARLLKRGLF